MQTKLLRTLTAVVVALAVAMTGTVSAQSHSGKTPSKAQLSKAKAKEAKKKKKKKKKKKATLKVKSFSSPSVAGPQGPQGPAGYTGATGKTGAAGPVGTSGTSGATGPAGAAGTPGSTGTPGAPGSNGVDGAPALVAHGWIDFERDFATVSTWIALDTTGAGTLLPTGAGNNNFTLTDASHVSVHGSIQVASVGTGTTLTSCQAYLADSGSASPIGHRSFITLTPTVGADAFGTISLSGAMDKPADNYSLRVVCYGDPGRTAVEAALAGNVEAIATRL